MENTAKNFALQLGSLISLYISITALLMLLFGVIEVTYTDFANGYWEYESATGGIRFGIALLVVFFPVYVILTRLVNTIRRNEQGMYLALTKWLIYLSLLIGGAAILGDLVAIVNSFLNGELTIRFMLKALSFFIVVGAAFTYYLMDARGYWQTRERASIQYAIAVSVFIIVALVLGFTRVEPPAQVREMKLDTRQIEDLTIIQSHILDHLSTNTALPTSLEEAFRGIDLPTAPEERTPYTYQVTNSNTFELCATFAYPTSKADQSMYSQPMYFDDMIIKNPNEWSHGAGQWCFKRVINTDSVKK